MAALGPMSGNKPEARLFSQLCHVQAQARKRFRARPLTSVQMRMFKTRGAASQMLLHQI